MRDRIKNEWGEKAARHMHLTDGFLIVALEGEILVGLISVYAKTLSAPLEESFDWYIDILEVSKDYRRKGIASQLVELAIQRAKEAGVYQIRSWSSENKIEAIPMWKALGFGLCVATYVTAREGSQRIFCSKGFIRICPNYLKLKRLHEN